MSENVRPEIIELLSRHPSGLSSDEVFSRLGGWDAGHKPPQIMAVLKRMVDDNLLVEQGTETPPVNIFRLPSQC
jgi:Fe2+ or Zn2+ uptake regulation protein